MLRHMKKLIAAAATGAVLLLAGCAPSPSHEEVSERFAIELASWAGEPSDWTEVAEGFADSAANDYCGKEEFWYALSEEPNLLYAWAAGCSMYYEGQMSPDLKEYADSVILEWSLKSVQE